MSEQNRYSQMNVSDRSSGFDISLLENKEIPLLTKTDIVSKIVFRIIAIILLIVFVCGLLVTSYYVITQITSVTTNINKNIDYARKIIVEHNKSIVDLEIKFDRLIGELNQYLNKFNHTIHVVK
jgi:hypothetical protein